tara:strand:- start:26689 stop:26886 length:198 start_codon:yes stop_codon:yes gene_type:complete
MKTIKEFLTERGTKVRKNESCDYVELMMDDHKCIEYGGKQYYLPESNLFGDDEKIFDFLVYNYGL